MEQSPSVLGWEREVRNVASPSVPGNVDVTVSSVTVRLDVGGGALVGAPLPTDVTAPLLHPVL